MVSSSEHFPRYRSLDLNKMVSIEMPAGLWLHFASAYESAKWSCGAGNLLSHLITEAILDPVYMRERMAASQAMKARAEQDLHTLLGMKPDGDVPPTPEGLG